MCGIFGLQLKQKNKELLKNFTSFMLKESELRGRDASGIYLQSENIQSTLKKPVNGFQLTKLVDYSSFFENIKDDTSNIFNLIGQCRLATNGKIFINDFNQPIETENLIGAGSYISKNTKPKSVYVPPRSVKLDKTSDQFKL